MNEYSFIYLRKSNQMRTRDQEKKKCVIEAAKQMVVEHGFNGFSMNRLAKACHISVATLYIYYQDKDDLFRTIGREIGSRFFESTLQNFTPNMCFADGLKCQWENRIAFMKQFPLDVAFYEVLRQSPYAQYIDQDRMGAFKQAMMAFFQTAIDRKELVPLQPETFWAIAYGPLYTLFNFEREKKSMGGLPFKLRQEHIDQAFACAIKALTP